MVFRQTAQILAEFKDGQATVLEPEKICRLYAAEGKVYAETENSTCSLRLRLYEKTAERLANRSFARISNGELSNLKKVKNFDLSFVGTICVSLSNGTIAYYLCIQAVCLQNQTTVRSVR